MAIAINIRVKINPLIRQIHLIQIVLPLFVLYQQNHVLLKISDHIDK